VARLLAAEGHVVTIVDGDVLRQAAAAPLGFSRADRDANGMQAAGLAKQALDRGELAICALVSPYRETRRKARELIGPERFLEVFIDAPLAVCESRDPKGLYARARAGLVTHFTGIDDPYEPPLEPDVILTTGDVAVEDNARRLVDVMLARLAMLAPPGGGQRQGTSHRGRP
jgi:sulfate adenylyltransferase